MKPRWTLLALAACGAPWTTPRALDRSPCPRYESKVIPMSNGLTAVVFDVLSLAACARARTQV